MLDDRKAAILRAIVEEYIETAQPVGSVAVSRIPGLSVSSATVRNEMSVLERDGYLIQPHTSAGRVPTDKGYRFFVDSLTPTGHLDREQSEQVRTFFAKAHGELEKMLGDTSRFLSGLTDYAGVVVRQGADPGRIRSVQVVGLSARVVIVVVVLANGAVEKRTLELSEDVSDAHVAAASAHLARYLAGGMMGHAVSVPPTGDEMVDGIVRAAAESIVHPSSGGDGEPQVFVGGAARMAASFDAIGTVRRVLDILEQQYVLVTLIRDILDRGLSVAIGAEHGVQSLKDCSIVISPYEVEGEPAGTVGILGPTRMHYDQALAAVAVVSKRLGKALSEGVDGR